jgi:hypothetical protein
MRSMRSTAAAALMSPGAVPNLSCRDSHDLDGVADHVGGALLALWSLRHLSINILSLDNDRPRFVPAECRCRTASKSLGERELSSG